MLFISIKQFSNMQLNYTNMQLEMRSHEVPVFLEHFKENLSGEPTESHNVVVEQLAVGPQENTPDDLRVSSEEESIDLLFIADTSRRPNRKKPTGRHNVSAHLPKDPDCEVCKFTHTTRAPCRNRPEARKYRVHHSQTFGDATRADHYFPKEENESRLQHRCVVVVEDLYILLGFNAAQRRTKLRKQR